MGAFLSNPKSSSKRERFNAHLLLTGQEVTWFDSQNLTDFPASYPIERIALKAVKIQDNIIFLQVSLAPIVHIPTAARNVYDVTGAGDTVIAAFTLAFAAGAKMEEAAVVANHAAGIVVGEVGTAVVTPEQLQKSLTTNRSARAKGIP